MSKKYWAVDGDMDVMHDDALQYDGPYARAEGAATVIAPATAATAAAATAVRLKCTVILRWGCAWPLAGLRTERNVRALGVPMGRTPRGTAHALRDGGGVGHPQSFRLSTRWPLPVVDGPRMSASGVIGGTGPLPGGPSRQHGRTGC